MRSGWSRSPFRIKRLLGLLRVYWEANPDLRLGQLVSNLAGVGVDIFNVEDDILETALRGIIQDSERPRPAVGGSSNPCCEVFVGEWQECALPSLRVCAKCGHHFYWSHLDGEAKCEECPPSGSPAPSED